MKKIEIYSNTPVSEIMQRTGVTPSDIAKRTHTSAVEIRNAVNGSAQTAGDLLRLRIAALNIARNRGFEIIERATMDPRTEIR